MNIVIEEKPFVHSIVDNFLSADDFAFLLEYVKSRVDTESRPLFLDGSNHYTEFFMNKEQSDLSRDRKSVV